VSIFHVKVRNKLTQDETTLQVSRPGMTEDELKEYIPTLPGVGGSESCLEYVSHEVVGGPWKHSPPVTKSAPDAAPINAAP